MTDAVSRLNRVISETLGVEPARVTPGATFTGDLGADSLNVVELIMALEDEFGVEIPDAEMDAIHTAADAARVIAALIPEPAR